MDKQEAQIMFLFSDVIKRDTKEFLINKINEIESLTANQKIKEIGSEMKETIMLYFDQ